MKTWMLKRAELAALLAAGDIWELYFFEEHPLAPDRKESAEAVFSLVKSGLLAAGETGAVLTETGEQIVRVLRDAQTAVSVQFPEETAPARTVYPGAEYVSFAQTAVSADVVRVSLLSQEEFCGDLMEEAALPDEGGEIELLADSGDIALLPEGRITLQLEAVDLRTRKPVRTLLAEETAEGVYLLAGGAENQRWTADRAAFLYLTDRLVRP